MTFISDVDIQGKPNSIPRGFKKWGDETEQLNQSRIRKMLSIKEGGTQRVPEWDGTLEHLKADTRRTNHQSIKSKSQDE